MPTCPREMRVFVPDCTYCGCCAAAGGSQRRQRLWEFTIAAPRDGWSGTEKAASTKLCLARWEEWVSRVI